MSIDKLGVRDWTTQVEARVCRLDTFLLAHFILPRLFNRHLNGDITQRRSKLQGASGMRRACAADVLFDSGKTLMKFGQNQIYVQNGFIVCLN
jgi:hypothetical protein